VLQTRLTVVHLCHVMIGLVWKSRAWPWRITWVWS